uniref:Uncharacterized protein n=1 Tax=Acrobeloides nanus TaxID=290746 RepID=A0A914DLW1_9BILA
MKFIRILLFVGVVVFPISVLSNEVVAIKDYRKAIVDARELMQKETGHSLGDFFCPNSTAKSSTECPPPTENYIFKCCGDQRASCCKHLVEQTNSNGDTIISFLLFAVTFLMVICGCAKYYSR